MKLAVEILDSDLLNNFLKKLGISTPWEGQMESNRVDFLFKVVRKYVTHPEYSFQNLAMASFPPEERKIPSRNSSIIQCLQTLRGMCIDHNYFMAVLFKSLGYDAWIVGSTVSLLPMPLNHPLCIVNLGNEGIWLVDMGTGSIFNQPIPLHALPYTYRVGGYTCIYRKVGDIYQGVYVDGDPMRGLHKDGVEDIRYTFNLQPIAYESFDPAMTTIFTDASSSFFLNNLYAFRYLDLNPETDEFDAVVFMGTTLVQYSRDITTKTLYENYEEMEGTFLKYFPLTSTELYRRATGYFQTSQERKGGSA